MLGQPHVLPCVLSTQHHILNNSVINHEYGPIDGLPSFNKQAALLAYGQSPLLYNKLAFLQSISGTGALRIAASLIRNGITGPWQVYVPNPTWGNHIPIFKQAGLTTNYYPYLDSTVNYYYYYYYY